jgi:hypothetical protein
MKGSGQLHAPAALLLEKETSVLIRHEIGLPLEPVLMTWRGENLVPTRTLGRPTCSQSLSGPHE